MDPTLSLTCDCEKVKISIRGVSLADANRTICGCRGCRSYAHYLGRQGAMLDEYGGTDVGQTFPRALHIERGREFIACLHQTPKGCLRWHTSCCKTPIGNTLGSPAVPFVGVILSSIDQHGDAALIDRIVGKPRLRINSPIPAPNSSLWRLPGMLARISAMMLRWRITGKHKPSPFFDPDSQQPLVRPIELSAAEYDALLANEAPYAMASPAGQP